VNEDRAGLVMRYTAQQALHWEVLAKDKLERCSQERSRMGLTWEEAEVAAVNRQEWPSVSALMWAESGSWSGNTLTNKRLQRTVIYQAYVI